MPGWLEWALGVLAVLALAAAILIVGGGIMIYLNG